MWTELDSQAAAAAFLAACRAFHDGSLMEIRVVTAGQVGETSAFLFLTDLSGKQRAVEIRCQGVVHLALRPSLPDHDSIISRGSLSWEGETLRLGLNFIGGPLQGPPGGSVSIPARDLSSPDVSVTARSMAWRPASAPSP